METLLQTLPHHTELSIGKGPSTCIDTTSENCSPECHSENIGTNINAPPINGQSSNSNASLINQSSDSFSNKTDGQYLWKSAMESHHILVCHGLVFHHAITNNLLKLTDVNLVIFDDCHRCVEEENHSYSKIVNLISHLPLDSQPHILGLTAAIAGTECSDPAKLKDTIIRMEKELNAYAETSMLILSERYGCRPKESIIRCKNLDDNNPVLLHEMLEDILEENLVFFVNCSIKVDNETDNRNPTEIPIQVLSECLNILYILGSWCTSSIAEYFVMQLDKIIKCEKNDIHKKFLRCVTTTLRLLIVKFEQGFHPDYDLEELLEYATPKVHELVSVLSKFKPEVDFIIISNEDDSENGDDFSDLSDLDDNDSSDDENDTSDSQNKSPGGSLKPLHIAVKRTSDGGHERVLTYSEDEEKNLCGIVFVENRFIAFGLNKIIEEVCAWDEDLCFIKSCHISGQATRGKAKVTRSYRRQEEALRKFRSQECNLVIATQELEEGIDVPKCNLVVRFDPPQDYRSYALSKVSGTIRSLTFEFILDIYTKTI